MEKRTILALVLTFMILVVWQYFVIEPQRIKQEKARAVAEKVESVKKAVSAEPVKAEAAPAAPVMPSATGKEEIIVTETPYFRAAWSSKGARLVSLRLKRFKQTIDEKAPAVELIKTPMPGVKMGAMHDGDVLFSSSGHGEIAVNDGSYELAFTGQMAQGIILKKIYSISSQGYLIGYKTVVENQTGGPLPVGMHLDLEEQYPAEGSAMKYVFEGPVLLNDRKLEEFKLSKIKKNGSYRDFDGHIKWFGYEDKYFLKAIIPQKIQETNVTIRRTDDNMVLLDYALPQASIQTGFTQTQELALFVGPKELNTLKECNNDLDKALDFGFFNIIAKPLLISLNWIQGHVNSYGWSIIILTFIIKFALYPLSLKSFVSMKELQKVQPLMKEIQAKYKDDKQKMNQAVMKLYQEHKINPLGGCLPLLLQIPILFALYKVFLQAIELRHTPFIIYGSWLPDLSAKDPLYITPILMGLSWFVQQWLTPATGDPTQRKIMMFMPIVFTFLFLSFPSGLVVYWLVSNILSIAQQAYINRVHA